MRTKLINIVCVISVISDAKWVNMARDVKGWLRLLKVGDPHLSGIKTAKHLRQRTDHGYLQYVYANYLNHNMYL